MGYNAYIKHTESDKVGVKFDKYKFIGYSKETTGYQFYNPIEKNIYLKTCYILRERIHSRRR